MLLDPIPARRDDEELVANDELGSLSEVALGRDSAVTVCWCILISRLMDTTSSLVDDSPTASLEELPLVVLVGLELECHRHTTRLEKSTVEGIVLANREHLVLFTP